MMNNTRTEPFVRMVKRAGLSPWQNVLIHLIAVIGALLTGAIITGAMGHNPLAVYAEMVSGSVGSPSVLRDTVRITIPLLITAIAISLAFRMRFWNIGAEGQILAGATAASYFALFFYSSMPSAVLLSVMAVASVIAGGLYALLPAVFKARWNTNETLFTLMLNYIAIEFIKYLQNGPWKDPRQRGFPKIAMFSAEARLPRVFGVHIGWIVAIVLVILVTIYLKKSKQGYEIVVVGESTPTARYAGMNVRSIICRTMFVSGALAGLAGFLQVAGANYTLSDSAAGGVGFTAITVAWLSKLNPIIMTPVAFFIAMLERGGNKIQTTFGVPSSVAELLTGIILFFILGCEFFTRYRLVFRGGKVVK
ncbi:MAG: ABC transporter permease [Clostridia bacterium]|nr:ABC transporter permease [Clostridia bacterium]